MSEFLNVRRCHVCYEVTESNDEIVKCTNCGKSLLPFFYFDKRKVADYSDNEVRPKENVDETHGQKYGPVRGLTAVWGP